MQQQPRLREQSSGPDPLVLMLLALGILLAFPCVLLILLSRWLPRRLAQWRGFWPLVALIGIAGLACFVLVAHPFRTLHSQVVQVLSEVIRQARAGGWSALRVWAALRPLWWESLFLAPAAAFLAHLLTPQNPRQHLLAANAQQADALQAARARRCCVWQWEPHACWAGRSSISMGRAMRTPACASWPP